MFPILLFAALPVGHYGSSDRSQIAKPLKGLSTVHVNYYLNDTGKLSSVTYNDLQPPTNKEMDSLGLKVASDDDFTKYNAAHDVPMPEMNVAVDVHTDDNGAAVYSVSVDISDAVLLSRKRSLKFSTTVWSFGSGTNALAGAKAVPVGDALSQCLQKFESDYDLANGKK